MICQARTVFVSMDHGITSIIYPPIFFVKFVLISRCKKPFIFPSRWSKLVELCCRASVADSWTFIYRCLEAFSTMNRNLKGRCCYLSYFVKYFGTASSSLVWLVGNYYFYIVFCYSDLCSLPVWTKLCYLWVSVILYICFIILVTE